MFSRIVEGYQSGVKKRLHQQFPTKYLEID